MRLDHAALSLTIAAQFLRCRGRSLWLQRCDFRTAEKPFLLTTVAQNIHVFLRESSLHKKHFFEWLKTADSSTACGMSTLKSPPPQAFSVSDVHPRLRKCPPGCTLDCGFKTSESPALRGFVAERCPITGTSIYLYCTKIERLSPPEKPSCKVRLFANRHSRKYRQKITATTLPLTVSHPAFQFLTQTDHVCFPRRKRVHTRLRQQDRTQGLTRRNRGPSLSRPQHGLELLVKSPPKEQPEKTDARQWRVSAFSGDAAPLGCVILSLLCQ